MMRICFSLLILTLAIGSHAAFFKKSKSKASPLDYERDIKPLLSKYCYDCHDDLTEKGDLSLEAFSSMDSILKNRAPWEKVLSNVRSQEMPPPKKSQPTAEERATLIQWLETEVFQFDCANPDPGRVTLRRLNRVEYRNTIRDLLGVEYNSFADFPADDTGYGFDNIGDVLSLPPILLEKYMNAAEEILDQAIVTEFSTTGPVIRLEAEKIQFDAVAQILKGRMVRIGREGEVYTSINFDKLGDYIFRVRAYGEQAGTEPAKMELRVNGEVLTTIDVTAREKSPAIYEFPFKANSGSNRISTAFINNYRNPEDPNPTNRDRNLVIDYLEICGPAGPKTLPATHTRIFPKPEPSSISAQQEYAREVLSDFGRRAYRRPLLTQELNGLIGFVELARQEEENFYTGIKLAMQAILVSPHFLFRGELQPDPNNASQVHLIDEFALASRLSYFLWSSMPDEELFELAERGRLRKNLDRRIKRMLEDPKSTAFVKNFAGQWLQLRNLDWIAPDPEKFPAFDESLRSAMRTETELFFASLLKENRSIIELLDGDYTFVNERLAEHYGLQGISGTHFRRVSLKGTARGGILSHASILTLTSNPTRTSLVKRGKWVLDNILGTPPPPPPPEVTELEEEAVLTGTVREQLEKHRDSPNCISCHVRMDPLGFAFENFDAIGAWRDNEGGQPIDATGELITGESFSNATELRKILAANKKDEFVRCLTEKLMIYALGRGVEIYDKCAIDVISERTAASNYKFRDLITEVVKSVPFQMRRGENHRISQALP